MSSTQRKINITLDKKTNERLNQYCLKRMQKNGKVIDNIRAKIAKLGVKDWLDEHEKDLTIKLE